MSEEGVEMSRCNGIKTISDEGTEMIESKAEKVKASARAL